MLVGLDELLCARKLPDKDQDRATRHANQVQVIVWQLGKPIQRLLFANLRKIQSETNCLERVMLVFVEIYSTRIHFTSTCFACPTIYTQIVGQNRLQDVLYWF